MFISEKKKLFLLFWLHFYCLNIEIYIFIVTRCFWMHLFSIVVIILTFSGARLRAPENVSIITTIENEQKIEMYMWVFQNKINTLSQWYPIEIMLPVVFFSSSRPCWKKLKFFENFITDNKQNILCKQSILQIVSAQRHIEIWKNESQAN